MRWTLEAQAAQIGDQVLRATAVDAASVRQYVKMIYHVQEGSARLMNRAYHRLPRPRQLFQQRYTVLGGDAVQATAR